MAESRRRGANSLFSGSSNQSWQNAKFTTAGNDVHNTTVNIHIPSPGELSPSGNAGLGQIWGRIVQQVSGFFQSPENRGALMHAYSETADDSSVMTGAQYSLGETSSQQDTLENIPAGNASEGNTQGFLSRADSERFTDGYQVSEMTNLDMQEIQALDVLTNAEIYTRSMLSSNAGLPCWYPEPRGSVGEKGIVPGDVGTFNLMDGFTKIFNIWEDESFAYQTPPRECASSPGRFAEGDTVVDGISAEVQRSEDESYIESYQLRCKAKQGAALVCTTSADLEQLVDVTALRQFIIRHAGAILQYANGFRQIGDEESLYIVSGCIKSDSWALAAYQDRTESSGEVLRLARRNRLNLNTIRVPTYDWLARGTGEARFGSNSGKAGEAYEGKDQSLFLRGFKLAFSQDFHVRSSATLRAKSNNGGSKDAPPESGSLANREQGHGHSRTADNLSVTHDGSRVGCSDSFDTVPEGVQVSYFPGFSRPAFHPSDRITQLLLELTGADCALCHDDDWRHDPRLSTPSWNDASCLGIVTSSAISALNGVAYLIHTRDEEHLPHEPVSDAPHILSRKFDARTFEGGRRLRKKPRLMPPPQISQSTPNPPHDINVTNPFVPLPPPSRSKSRRRHRTSLVPSSSVQTSHTSEPNTSVASTWPNDSIAVCKATPRLSTTPLSRARSEPSFTFTAKSTGVRPAPLAASGSSSSLSFPDVDKSKYTFGLKTEEAPRLPTLLHIRKKRSFLSLGLPSDSPGTVSGVGYCNKDVELAKAISNRDRPIYTHPSGSVVAGTLEGLVDRLVDNFHLRKDEKFREVMLTACVDFATPKDVYAMLWQRFNEAELDEQHARVTTRYNVIQIMSYWLNRRQFPVDAELLGDMREFCRKALGMVSSPTMVEKVDDLLHSIETLDTGSRTTSALSGKMLAASEISPQGLALALTLLEGDKFRQITPSDYLAHLCRRPGYTNVQAAITVNSKVLLWIKQSLLHYDALIPRASVWKFFINAAEECRKLRNYQSLITIAVALGSAPVQRLTATAHCLNRNMRDKLEALVKLPDPKGNHSRYREALREAPDPAYRDYSIPWLAVHLKDLDSVLRQNNRVVEIKGQSLINFQRYTRFIDRLEEIFRLPPPDLERYRSQGQLAYLENKLEKVVLDEEAENELVKRSRSIQAVEESLRSRRIPELTRLGFEVSQVARRVVAGETLPSVVVERDSQTDVAGVEELFKDLRLEKE